MAGDIHLKEHSCVGTAPDNSAFLDDVKAVVRRSLHMIFKIEESEREISVPKFFLKIQQATLGPKVQEHQQVMASIDSGIEGEAPPMVRNFKDVREQEQPMQFLQLSVADNSTAQDEVASLDSKYVFEVSASFCLPVEDCCSNSIIARNMCGLWCSGSCLSILQTSAPSNNTGRFTSRNITTSSWGGQLMHG